MRSRIARRKQTHLDTLRSEEGCRQLSGSTYCYRHWAHSSCSRTPGSNRRNERVAVFQVDIAMHS